MLTPAPVRSAGPHPDSRSLFIQAERVATLLLIAVIAWAVSPASLFAQTTAADTSGTTGIIQGTVVDKQDGLPLPGANVVLRPGEGESAVAGATTSVEGTYRLTNIEPGTYLLNVSFVGFQSVKREVSVLPNDVNTVDIRLGLQSQSLGQVVVSASRRQEKILNAPASISVVRNEQIQQTVASSSAEALRRAMSVDVARTGVNTREVVLRGFNNAFSGDTFVLTDYREAAVPSLDVNLFSSMPISTLDVDRVEIVRGPGSALYGPGVANGVVQFFSRDPFNDPGIGVSATTGSRAYRGGEFRAAETIGDVGFKVTGRYAAANEWELDPDNPQDLAEIEQYRIYTSFQDVPDGRDVRAGDFNADGERDFRLRREDEYRSFATSGLVQWRPTEETKVSVNGGYSGVKSVVQSGIGTLQSDMYGYRYGQLRVRSGGFFGQVFYNGIDSGEDSYAYGSGAPFIDDSFQWNGQLQYNATAPSIATDFTFGVDGDFVRPRTGGTITGQFEGRDDINQVGAYTQSTISIGADVDLIGAIRADYNNVTEQLRGSPRGALVYRVNPQNSLRVSYNRSYSAPQTRNYFLDVVARNRNILSSEAFGSYDVVLRGIGAVDGFTFDTFRSNRGQSTPNPAVQFFIPDITNTSATDFGDSVSLDAYPVAPVYRAAAAFFQSQVETGDLNPNLANVIGANNFDLYGELLQALSGNADPSSRASEADGDVILGLLNSDAPLGYSQVDAPVDIEPLGQTMTQTFEAGYKGEFDRVAFELSAYYEQKKNFIGPLRQQSPFVYLNRQFLAGDLESVIANSPEAQALIDELVNDSDFRNADQVVQALANTLGGTPTAVVQPDNAEQLFAGNVAPEGTQQVGGFLSYRNFGTVQYWGFESSLFYTPADWVEMFTNVSVISDEFFDNVELEESDEQLSVALNAPSFKMKGGASVEFGGGWHVGVVGEYVDGFPVQSGPYIGDVDAYTVFDLSAGYDFGNGLRFDVTANNVLGNDHREFVGAPQIGRLILGRVTYQIQ